MRFRPETGVDVVGRQRFEPFPPCWSYCMNTRFQYSRKRSFSPPGRSLGRSRTRPRDRSTAPSTARKARSDRPARSSPSAGIATIRSRGTPTSSQWEIASSSGPSPSPSSPSNTVTQMSLGGEAEHFARELPGELDRLVLEVVAEGEVAEHLKERQVPGGVADVVDVDRAKDLLAVGQARGRRGLLAEEVGLQRVHPGDGQQRRGVVRGGHQRSRGDALVAAFLEERQVALADLVRCHRAKHLSYLGRNSQAGVRQASGGDRPVADDHVTGVQAGELTRRGALGGLGQGDARAARGARRAGRARRGRESAAHASARARRPHTPRRGAASAR